MTRILPRIAIFLSLLAFSSFATATPISVDPPDSNIELGTTISVDIVIAPETNLLIGAFDIVLNFDSAIVSLLDVVFGTSLNDPSDPFTSFLQLVDVLSAGSVQVAEASLLSVPDLGARQGDSPLVLFSLTFSAVGVGTSGLDFGTLLVSNGFGNGLESVQLSPGTITVRDRPVSVPEPSPGILLLIGLLLLAGRKVLKSRTDKT